MKYWQTPEFKALQKAWYERLEADGFVDAEKLVGSEMLLAQVADHQLQRANDLEIETRIDYFHSIRLFVSHWKFEREVDCIVMAKHADGLSERVIAKEIRTEGHKQCRNTVSSIIQKYREAWGLPRVVMTARRRTG